ncbi:MAG: T9SS type A sorting domain-containing protein [Bacteroidetes bacterium]|nr:T9SS type A sorting domain-containing protein [Bacteroidota bacterium]
MKHSLQAPILKTTLKRFVLLILSIVAFSSLNAQTTYTVGSNTGTTPFYPIYNYYGHSYSQTIYLASDLAASGATGPAYISSIRYFYATDGTPHNLWDNWKIYMKNVATTSFTSSTSWETGLQQVFNGQISIPAAGNWLTITLDTPFLWDGTSNIVLGTYEGIPGYANPYSYWQNTSGLPDTRSMIFYDDNVDPDPLSPPTATRTDNLFPDIQFDMYPATLCSGMPPGGIAVATNTITCSNVSLTMNGVSLQAGVMYQWQSSPDGSTWTNLGASQYGFSYSAQQTSATYYRCISTCTAASLSATSTPVFIDQNPFYACYCTPNFLDCATYNDNLSNISFATLTHTPTCNAGDNGYEDYTSSAPTISVSAGATYTFNGTINANAGATGTDYILAWIDYNHNSSFESSEMTYIGSGGASAVVTNSITIPFTAPGGLTRMRIKTEASYSTITSDDACSNIGYYGQTTDYLIDITPTPPCSGTPVAGTAVSNYTSVCSNTSVDFNLNGNGLVSGINYQWQSSTNGTTWTNLGAVQNTVPFSISSQSVTTYYQCILTCPGSSLSATSGSVTVAENPFYTCYCTPDFLDCSYNDNFSDLTFATLSHTPTCNTGDNGYEDYSSAAPTISVTANQTYTFTGTVNANAGNNGNDYAFAWIDFDHNGIFDGSEMTMLGSGGAASVITNTIFIPYTAQGGLTKMRIKTEASYSPMSSENSCGNNYYYGETIDYMVDITPAPTCSATPAAGNTTSSYTTVCANTSIDLNLSGNGVVSGINYQWQSSPDGTTWTNMGSGQTTVPYTVTSQTATTYYHCLLTCISSSLSAASVPVMIGQNAITSCYCIPDSADCSYSADQIDTVSFGTLYHGSACTFGGYTNYGDSSSVAIPDYHTGVTYTMTVASGTQSYDDAAVWIDYDHNGVFDASEYTYLSSSGTIYFNGNITIPTSALLGQTRMRVRVYSGYLSSADACNNPSGGLRVASTTLSSKPYGETEDYTINILPPDCSTINFPPSMTSVSSSTVLCAPAQATLDVSPALQPATGVTYQWQSSADGVSYANMGTATSSSSVAATVTGAIYYQCQVSCNNTLQLTSSSVMLTTSNPTLTASVVRPVICPGESDTLKVTGSALTYTWSTSDVGTKSIVTPTVNTTYTVTGTDGSGCNSVATVSVQVNLATDITGTVTTASGSVSGNVILYRYEPFLTKFDSVASTAIQANGSYLFSSVNTATYIVKAVPAASSLQITYAPNVISWQGATPLTHSCVVNSTSNIQVQAYASIPTSTNDIGSMSGYIYQGAGYDTLSHKTTAPGQPIPGVIVKGGKNPGAAIFAQTTSDANGHYAFSNLPPGNFFILVDIPGLDTSSTYHRVITINGEDYNFLDFVVDSQKVNPIYTNPTSVNDIVIADNVIRVFPNPANTFVNINYSLLESSKVELAIYDMIGKQVKHVVSANNESAGEHKQQVSIDDLSAGVYFIKLRINTKEATIKLFINN